MWSPMDVSVTVPIMTPMMTQHTPTETALNSPGYLIRIAPGIGLDAITINLRDSLALPW